MSTLSPASRRMASARIRLGGALVLGLIAATVMLMTGLALLAPLIGWDVAAAGYLIWAFLSVHKLDPSEMAEFAVREDPGRAATDLILIAASVASVAGVFAVIAAAGPGSPLNQEAGIAIGVVSLVLSWALVHALYAERYARLYFTAPLGGIDFNDAEPPCYIDFAYLALTLGMTYQVSDTTLKSRAMRSTALRHALLSYLLGAVIIAATINLLAALART
jgi:uncharacterized membrane protein